MVLVADTFVHVAGMVSLTFGTGVMRRVLANDGESALSLQQQQLHSSSGEEGQTAHVLAGCYLLGPEY